jgi:hypothetical protein
MSVVYLLLGRINLGNGRGERFGGDASLAPPPRD